MAVIIIVVVFAITWTLAGLETSASTLPDEEDWTGTGTSGNRNYLPSFSDFFPEWINGLFKSREEISTIQKNSVLSNSNEAHRRVIRNSFFQEDDEHFEELEGSGDNSTLGNCTGDDCSEFKAMVWNITDEGMEIDIEEFVQNCSGSNCSNFVGSNETTMEFFFDEKSSHRQDFVRHIEFDVTANRTRFFVNFTGFIYENKIFLNENGTLESKGSWSIGRSLDGNDYNYTGNDTDFGFLPESNATDNTTIRGENASVMNYWNTTSSQNESDMSITNNSYEDSRPFVYIDEEPNAENRQSRWDLTSFVMDNATFLMMIGDHNSSRYESSRSVDITNSTDNSTSPKIHSRNVTSDNEENYNISDSGNNYTIFSVYNNTVYIIPVNNSDSNSQNREDSGRNLNDQSIESYIFPISFKSSREYFFIPGFEEYLTSNSTWYLNSSKENSNVTKDRHGSARDLDLSSLSPDKPISPEQLISLLRKTPEPPILLTTEQKVTLLSNLPSSTSITEEQKHTFLNNDVLNFTKSINSLSESDKKVLIQHSAVFNKLNNIEGHDKLLILPDNSHSVSFSTSSTTVITEFGSTSSTNNSLSLNQTFPPTSISTTKEQSTESITKTTEEMSTSTSISNTTDSSTTEHANSSVTSPDHNTTVATPLTSMTSSTEHPNPSTSPPEQNTTAATLTSKLPVTELPYPPNTSAEQTTVIIPLTTMPTTIEYQSPSKIPPYQNPVTIPIPNMEVTSTPSYGLSTIDNKRLYTSHATTTNAAYTHGYFEEHYKPSTEVNPEKVYFFVEHYEDQNLVPHREVPFVNNEPSYVDPRGEDGYVHNRPPYVGPNGEVYYINNGPPYEEPHGEGNYMYNVPPYVIPHGEDQFVPQHSDPRGEDYGLQQITPGVQYSPHGEEYFVKDHGPQQMVPNEEGTYVEASGHQHESPQGQGHNIVSQGSLNQEVDQRAPTYYQSSEEQNRYREVMEGVNRGPVLFPQDQVIAEESNYGEFGQQQREYEGIHYVQHPPGLTDPHYIVSRQLRYEKVRGEQKPLSNHSERDHQVEGVMETDLQDSL